MVGSFQIMTGRCGACSKCKKPLKYGIQYYNYAKNSKQNWVCNDCVCEILKNHLEGTNED